MERDLIDVDGASGESRGQIDKLMLLVPAGDREDKRLRRLLLFRLRLDGFTDTRNYLVERTRSADRCGYSGSLYDYLKDDLEENACSKKTL